MIHGRFSRKTGIPITLSMSTAPAAVPPTRPWPMIAKAA